MGPRSEIPRRVGVYVCPRPKGPFKGRSLKIGCTQGTSTRADPCTQAVPTQSGSVPRGLTTGGERAALILAAYKNNLLKMEPSRVTDVGRDSPSKISGYDLGQSAGRTVKRAAARTYGVTCAAARTLQVEIIVAKTKAEECTAARIRGEDPTAARTYGCITLLPGSSLALPAGPAEAACALCQRAPREPVRADCGHRFCRACVVRFWAEEDGPFPCPECADDCWQRAVEPGRPPLSRRLLALEEAAAAPARDGPASEAALQLLCRADAGPLCAACRMAAGPEPPEWEPRWRKALRGKENKGSVEIMRKDLNDARDLHGQAESAAAVWKGHVMDRRKKALTDYKKLRAFFVEEEEHFLQEAEKEEGLPEDELTDPTERFRSLLQAVSELEKKHRNLGLSMLLQ
ncbi:hypothetical protein H8959_001847 [Pygathrix nigripes]